MKNTSCESTTLAQSGGVLLPNKHFGILAGSAGSSGSAGSKARTAGQTLPKAPPWPLRAPPEPPRAPQSLLVPPELPRAASGGVSALKYRACASNQAIWSSFLESSGSTGPSGSTRNGVRNCCSDPPLHTRRGPGRRELNKLPQMIAARPQRCPHVKLLLLARRCVLQFP